MKKLLYLHGFNSSPLSHKALLFQHYLQQRACQELLICPQIPEVPGEAMRFLEQLVERTLQEHDLSFVGSSLGGYYATYFAEKYSGDAVLINPSVQPYETLKACLGENRFYYEDGSWDFDETHIQQLLAMDVAQLRDPKRYLVLLQTGDETLDYRQAAEKYKEAQCVIEAGGNHSFVGLERHMQDIIKFCGIPCD